jgi:hypothetical protein
MRGIAMHPEPKFQASLLDSESTDQPTELSIYEQMHRYLYDYHFGRITFLELLDKWKEVLNLPIRDNE